MCSIKKIDVAKYEHKVAKDESRLLLESEHFHWFKDDKLRLKRLTTLPWSRNQMPI